jgi:uncharacterized protein YukE
MGGAHANPDDLRRFARSLRNFSKEIEAQLNRLNGEFRGLDWKDDQQRRFEQEFQKSTASMKSFLHSIENYAPALDRKARALDEYRKA